MFGWNFKFQINAKINNASHFNKNSNFIEFILWEKKRENMPWLSFNKILFAIAVWQKFSYSDWEEKKKSKFVSILKQMIQIEYHYKAE